MAVGSSDCCVVFCLGFSPIKPSDGPVEVSVPTFVLVDVVGLLVVAAALLVVAAALLVVAAALLVDVVGLLVVAAALVEALFGIGVL
jgi:hypothetical protein